MLLRERGILWAAPDEPVVDRRGASAPWMFYSWNISLTSDGGEAAARCLIAALSEFETTQIATYGATAVPLLTGTVLASQGRYRGLVAREQPKGHAGGRQIEGPADRSEPVVLIDDSISSGKSFLAGAAVFERHGFTVLGGVCLVRFPGRGGVERAEALGYRMHAIFDIWDDIGMERTRPTPGYRRVPEPPQAGQIEDGLTPPQIARAAARQLLAQGTAPRPPNLVNTALGAPGGVWVSLRDRSTNERIARDGFWHFDPQDADLARDIVLATIKTVTGAALTIERLEQAKLAVTLFGELERISPRDLDFQTFGIVARSAEWPVKVGGALPNTQVFTSEAEQLALARRNARLADLEPYDLFRHSVTKFVEGAERWLPYGVPDPPGRKWAENPDIGLALTERAREILVSAAAGDDRAGAPLPDDLLPHGFSAIAVSLYRQGVIGCALSERTGLDDAVVGATRAAMADRRFGGLGDQALDVCPVVSVLTDPEVLRGYEPAAAARKLRLGLDSIAVDQAGHRAFLLDSVAPHYEWDKARLVSELLRKAGAKPAKADWTTYRTSTWMWSAQGPTPHRFGFAPPTDDCNAASLENDLALLGGHLHANLLASGLPCYARSPTAPWRWDHGTGARLVHGLHGLLIAGRTLGRMPWIASAETGLRSCLESVSINPETGYGRLKLEGEQCGAMADATLLAASADVDVVAGGAAQAALVMRLRALLRHDGAIHPDGQAVRAERDNDYLPSAVLVALAGAGAGAGSEADEALWRGCMSLQMGRFSRLHRWGQAGWIPQACRRLFDRTGDRRYAEHAFEVADWSIDHQVERTGAFLSDLAPGGPTFHTAFIAEGLVDAWRLALGDARRCETYETAFWNAMRFVRQLIIRPQDAPCLIDAAAIGGVRGALNTSIMRVDYTSHAIFAIASGLALCRSKTEVQANGSAGSGQAH